ncbi:glycoside hydrolase family 16 protein [Aeoliella mucimassa]|uniref:Beta-glucanase n=1 Tax=Aeoliella mucimassa TaxID=2527972 RepID=A0A518AU77_9BACT|nr:glycoside hydrolase family 16 protein [Aeoliella mucimassa]QDU58278.1 Beta-glucanase precursor [Aeoliella mucimassa]
MPNHPPALLLSLIACQLLLCMNTGFADPPEGYELVWADEFDVDGPVNPENWTFEKGFVRNEELQWYQPENAFCKDGFLVIEGRRERRDNPSYDPNAGRGDWRRNRQFIEYTSSSLKTQGLQEWTYGLFEIRARIDARDGLWPAIWMLGVRGGWPRNGEIDIMEFYDNSILANTCWQHGRRRGQVWDTGKIPLSEFGEGWADEFHVWRMLWTEEEIRLSVDDRVLNTTDLAEVDRTKGDFAKPFRQPNYLLLNLAIGGKNGGDPSQTEFPGTYQVDYVRMYQKPANEETPSKSQ